MTWPVVSNAKLELELRLNKPPVIVILLLLACSPVWAPMRVVDCELFLMRIPDVPPLMLISPDDERTLTLSINSGVEVEPPVAVISIDPPAVLLITMG